MLCALFKPFELKHISKDHLIKVYYYVKYKCRSVGQDTKLMHGSDYEYEFYASKEVIRTFVTVNQLMAYIYKSSSYHTPKRPPNWSATLLIRQVP